MAIDLTSPSAGLNGTTGGMLAGFPHVMKSWQDIFTTRFGARIMQAS